ncbi:MAG: adenylate/guanylate cyclase domain-containing protein [Dehalococcoidia bacterium]
MEQHIRFCTTSDGLRIAYATVGEGPPLVVISGWLSHLQFEWTSADVRAFWESLAHGRLLIRYDKRGTGLSDWEVEDVSLEARLRDLDAIVDAMGLERFELLGISEGGMLAIIYAARHPEKVDRLVLYGAYPRVPFAEGVVKAFLTMVRAQWGMGSAAFAAFIPSGDPDQVAWFTELQRTATSGDNAARLLEATVPADVTAILRDISVPTLVAHRRADSIHPFDLAREMAALIPNARLEPLDGNIYWPWWGDTAAVVRAIRGFLGTEQGTPSGVAVTHLPSGMTAILFADIVDSTALTERLGDTAFRARARDLDASLRAIIRDHSGTPIEGKLLGDGVLAVFTSARQAIEAALACGRAGDDGGLPLHLGIHAGDVIEEDGNVFGGAVNIAARIAGESAPGEVLVSDTVRSLARTSAGVSFEDRGDHELKGIAEPVHVYEVRQE